MGTFRARFTIFSEAGDAFSTSGAGDDVEKFYDGNSNKNGTITFHLTGDCFFLDGAVVGIQFGELPAGFVPIPPLEITSPGAFGTQVGFITTNGAATVQETITYEQYGPRTESVGPGVGNQVITINDLDIDSALGLLALLSIQAIKTLGSLAVASITAVLDVSGEYGVQSFSWSIETPGPVAGGDEIVVVATDPEFSLTDVTEICFTFGSLTICTTDFIEQTPTRLVFVLPSGVDYTGFVSITGTTFSGSVFLGSLEYLFEDASGIYKLVKNKTSDTIYAPARDGTTVDVKIPNPRAKSGFIGG